MGDLMRLDVRNQERMVMLKSCTDFDKVAEVQIHRRSKLVNV